jgi:hypothetical protein
MDLLGVNISLINQKIPRSGYCFIYKKFCTFGKGD